MTEVSVDRWVPHPRPKVWRALWDPTLAERWLPFRDYRPVPGHRFSGRGPNGWARCEVVAVDPPACIQIAWNEGAHASRVTVALADESGGTRITVVHTELAGVDRAPFLALWTGTLAAPLAGVLESAAGGAGAAPVTVGLALALGAAGLLALGIGVSSLGRPGAEVEPPAGHPAGLAPAMIDARDRPSEEGSPSPAPRQPLPDLRLTDALVYERSLPGLHPLFPRSEADRRTRALIFDTLFYLSAITHEVKSRVVARAERVGPMLRVELRDDVRFHDGSPLTAEDVCFSVDAALHPQTPGAEARRASGLEACRVVGSLTAELQFARPHPDLERRSAVIVLPRHAFTSFPLVPDHPFATTPIGTGPYRAVRGRTSVRLTAHDSPHNPARIPEMSILEADPLVAVRTVVAGHALGIVDASPAALAEARTSDVAGARTFDTRSVLTLALNPGTLADPSVRDAIAAAIDRRALCELHYGDDPMSRCEPLSGPWPRRSPYANRSIPVPALDPGAMRRSMEAAGAARVDGFWVLDGEALTVRLGYDRDARSRMLDLPHQLRNQLVAAGFRVELVESTQPDAATMDLWLSRFTFELHDDVRSLVAPNALGARSDAVERLLARGDDATTETELQDARHALHAVVAEEHWVLPLSTDHAMGLWRFDLQSQAITPGTHWDEVSSWQVRGAPPAAAP